MFNKKEEKIYYGKNKELYFFSGNYHLELGDLIWGLEGWINNILTYKEPEYEFAKWLIKEELPDNIEEILISKFNELKKKSLLHEDKIKAKKHKILQAYK